MPAEQGDHDNIAPRRRHGLRPATVLAIGIVIGVLCQAALGALALWFTHVNDREAIDDRQQALTALSHSLAQTSEVLLALPNTASLHKVLVDARRRHHLSQCRIMLPDGRVLIDGMVSDIDQAQAPKTWSAQPLQPVREYNTDGSASIGLPITVADRGTARLDVSWFAHDVITGDQDGDRGTMLLVIGALGVVALLCTLKFTRSSLHSLGPIREALLAADAGEQDTASLSVSPRFGPDARVWNALMTERAALRRASVARQAGEALGARRQDAGDVVAACEAMSHGLVLIDTQQQMRYANGAACVLMRGKHDAMIGTPLTQWVDDAALAQAIGASVDSAQRRRTTIVVESRDDSEAPTLRYAVRPIGNDDQLGAAIIIEDITQQRVAEAARHAFVAQAAHELRTPLTNIRLYVEQAIDGDEDEQSRVQAINVINQEATRLERIVDDMLSVAEIESGEMKLRHDDVRIDELLTHMRADFQAQADKKQIQLVFDLSPKLPVIQADRDKIGLVLINVIGNALKYTPQKGKVTVIVDVTDDEQRIVFDVRDTGIGIDSGEIERIFDKFYRANDRRVAKITGTGLGLALTRAVVQQHGGEITIESELDKGSRFVITLPTNVTPA